MKYNKTSFTITCSEPLKLAVQELLIDAAGELGYESFDEEDGIINGYIPTMLYSKSALENELLHFPIQEASITFTTTELEEQNWNEEWEKNGFKPININNKIIIYDARNSSDSAIEIVGNDVIKIGIEAKQAFGTGTHETTRLVISELLNIDLHNKRVLDCGCGTGILSITASKLGAEEIVGYDIDEWSVENSKHNAELNNTENIEILHGDSNSLSHVCGFFDVVIANINRNVLLEDIPQFNAVMHDTATLILSGFYLEDVPLLIAKAEEYGFTKAKTTEDNNWACITFTR